MRAGPPRTRGELRDHRRARVAHSLERRGQVRRVNAHGIAVDAATAVVAQQDSLEDPVEERARVVPLEPFPCERDGRLDELAPLPRGEATVNLLQPRQQPRNRDRPLADVEHLRPGVAEVDEVLLHLAEPRGRHAEEAIEHRRLAARLVHEGEAATRRPGQWALGHERGERSGEERVDRIPALTQHARTGLGGQRMTGCDRASHPGRVKR